MSLPGSRGQKEGKGGLILQKKDRSCFFPCQKKTPPGARGHQQKEELLGVAPEQGHEDARRPEPLCWELGGSVWRREGAGESLWQPSRAPRGPRKSWGGTPWLGVAIGQGGMALNLKNIYI